MPFVEAAAKVNHIVLTSPTPTNVAKKSVDDSAIDTDDK